MKTFLIARMAYTSLDFACRIVSKEIDHGFTNFCNTILVVNSMPVGASSHILRAIFLMWSYGYF